MNVGGPRTELHAATRWSVRLLDVFCLERGGEVVEKLYARKQDKLLAYLALNRGRPHGRAELAQVLWPGKADGLARNRLAEVLYHLRMQSRELGLAQLVVANRSSLQLDPHVSTDVIRFETLVSRGIKSENLEVGTKMLREALGLYGAGLLPLFGDDDWLHDERTRLERVRQLAEAHFVDELQRDVWAAATSSGHGRLSREPHATFALEVGSPVMARAEMLPGTRLEAVPDETGVVLRRLSGQAAQRWILGDPIEDLQRRHADQLVELAEEAEPHLRGVGRSRWLALLEARKADIKAALTWALEAEEHGVALRLASALEWYWFAGGRVGEGRWFLEQALATDEQDRLPVAAKAMTVAGSLARQDGDLQHAQVWFERARDVWSRLGDTEGLARAHKGLANIAYREGDCDDARRLHRSAVDLIRTVDEPELLAVFLKDAALVEIETGEYATAEELLRERLDIGRSLRDAYLVARALKTLGTVALTGGDLIPARSLFEQALREFERGGELDEVAFCLRSLGCIFHEEKQYTTARSLYEGSLRLTSALVDMRGSGEALRLLGALDHDIGEVDEAAREYRESIRLLRAAGDHAGLIEAETGLARVVASQ
jgi:tetratricopeptide (TPR) repeat protein